MKCVLEMVIPTVPAVHAGVAQVVLPCWFDHFATAERVEHLALGASARPVSRLTTEAAP